MQLSAPFIITPRLEPGIQIGNAFISIAYSSRQSSDGRTVYEYSIDLPGQLEYRSNDLKSGCQGGSLREGMESLLAFLGACAESMRSYNRSGPPGENVELFPRHIAEWAAQNSDELSMAQLDIEENPNCLIEDGGHMESQSDYARREKVRALRRH